MSDWESIATMIVCPRATTTTHLAKYERAHAAWKRRKAHEGELELALRMCARELAARRVDDWGLCLDEPSEADVDDVVQEFLAKATGFGSEEAT